MVLADNSSSRSDLAAMLFRQLPAQAPLTDAHRTAQDQFATRPASAGQPLPEVGERVGGTIAPTTAVYSGSPAAAPRTLLDILFRTVGDYPEAVALDDGITSLSYRELLRRVESLALDLYERGISAGDRVGIQMDAGRADLYIAVLAVLARGAAYVPVGCDEPEDLATMVWEEAEVCAVVEAGLKVRPIAGTPPSGQTRPPAADDDAWIIFACGSTGKPKGVAISHRSAAASVDAEASAFCLAEPLGPGDRVLTGLSAGFDASCAEMWRAWRNGAALVPVPRDVVRSAEDMGPWMEAQGITVVSAVPSLAAPWSAGSLENIRLLIFGGESCPSELAARLAAPGREVWNTYGPTGAILISCGALVDGTTPVRIGLPLPGWQLAVVDKADQPVAWGEEGELVIGGVGLGRCLDPDEDAGKYPPIDSLGWPRAYRSGDLVRADREGLVFAGRSEVRVKSTGRRFEPSDTLVSAAPSEVLWDDSARTVDAVHEGMTASLNPLLLQSPHQQSVRWSPGERLEQLFEGQCDSLRRDGRAGQLAVDTQDSTLTYGQLDARANQLARHLLADGAQAGDRIALLFDHAVWSYVSILAVLKIQAAYVPLDAGFPTDRMAYIMEDSGTSRVLTLSHLTGLLPEICSRTLSLDVAATDIEGLPDSRLTDIEKPEPVEDLAYIIYTSGSTGRPKGVAVEHSSICNFVRVAAEVYGYQSDDRVYQGLTVAFDFSVEEIWVPWMAGATLVPKPSSTSLLGADLGRFLIDNRISAMCCVPTLLATLEEDLPGLRFLLVSGEACPRDLAERWYRPGRRFLNTYGPTEATVTATWDVMHPDKPITLGQPLPTYTTMILDPDEPRALPRGEMGEIGIAGIGLAVGYINRPEKTDEVFIPDFMGIPNNPSGRIYRSGDLGRITDDGIIEYYGRIDTQVKVRGYRIELSEIESVLLQVPGIAQAVVDTHESAPGMTELAAFYTLRTDVSELAPQMVKEELRDRLPGYMVPAFYEQLETIPMLPSDKADRKSLPTPRNRVNTSYDSEYCEPTTDIEAALAGQLAAVLGLERVSVEAHIFDHLGASSLLIAHFSAALRKKTELPPVGVQVIYQHPTIRQLAAAIAAPTTVEPWAEQEPTPQPKRGRAATFDFVLCGFLQAVLAIGYSYAFMATIVAGYLWVVDGSGMLVMWGRSIIFAAGFYLALCIVPILLKWLVLGRWKEEQIRIWSLAYVKFWFVRALVRLNPLAFFAGTPILPFYLRLLGAKIGSNVTILTPFAPVCTDLLTIGDNTVINKDTYYQCYRAHNGWIQTGPVTLGQNVQISERCVLDIGSTMGDGAQLGHSSSLQRLQTVPAGESWHGSPAVPTDANYRNVEHLRPSRRRQITYSAFVLLGDMALLSPLLLLAIALLVPAYLETDHLNYADPGFYTDLAIASFVLLFGGIFVVLGAVTTIPRLLNRLIKPGRTYPLYGLHYAAHRLIVRMTNIFQFMHITGDSSLVVHYLRLLGYKQPNLVQTGSNFGTELDHDNPYLTTVGSGTMVSDGVSIMNASYSSTSFSVSEVEIGTGNFFGNDIPYPAGARAGDNVLFGSKTMVPIHGEIRQNVGLLGSPAFEIPRSLDRDTASLKIDSREEIVRRLPAKNRHNAMSIGLYLASRWILVLAGLLAASFAIILFPDVPGLGLYVSVVGFGAFIIVFFIVLERAAQGFKAMVPIRCSIYDVRFWRHERFWRFIGYPLPFFDGTPFKPMFWRLYGVRMGKRVFDDGCVIPEKTLVSIGDDASLNLASVVQCHSMEDGVFKLDAIDIGRGVTLGVGSYLLYDVVMGDSSVLEADSFLMKGSQVPGGARYGGNLAQEIV
ncbi:Pls/PosA family non-ribosomal peptide synthetase [Arthrobacter pigmenti]